MQDATFNEIANLALQETGQTFRASKAYLMEARLAPISRREGFATLDDLAQCLRARPNPRFRKEIAAALTAKRTQFFAERAVLDQIVNHALPARLKHSKTGRLRVLCAGVSTGQEAWSLAILLSELIDAPVSKADIEIVGTDVSTPALQQAEAASYGHFDVQKGLSIHRLMTHFSRHDSGDWSLKAPLREHVKFRRHNLLSGTGELGQFDVILCRDVLRDMAPPSRQKATQHLSEALLPGGYLFTGAAESLIAVVEGLNPASDMRGAYIYRQPKHQSTAA
ncbi:MAG: protein-glutamate O-methyltransferase CheR [Pseudomonadota bacterium]